MKAEEKQTLYTFIKTTCDYLDGFHTDETLPKFTDDSVPTQPFCVSTQQNGEPQKLQTDTVLHQNEAVHTNSEYANLLLPISQQVSGCEKCKLSKTRNQTVFGEGPAELSNITIPPAVMVIGEGPGAEENKTGRPFVGRAGQLLDKMLDAIQLSRHKNCYIANIVKCRPPNNRNPEQDEISACREYLEKQIQIISPKIILLMGRVAVHTILDTSEGIGRIHGRTYDYNGIPAIPTYHPSALLHNEALKRPAWEDLKIFRKKLDEIQK